MSTAANNDGVYLPFLVVVFQGAHLEDETIKVHQTVGGLFLEMFVLFVREENENVGTFYDCSLQVLVKDIV